MELENKLMQNKINNIYNSDYYNNDNTFSLEFIEILEKKFPKNKFILVNKDTEEKIYIESSSNYRSLLMKIKGILNEKQWEEFFSCVYKK